MSIRENMERTCHCLFYVRLLIIEKKFEFCLRSICGTFIASLDCASYTVKYRYNEPLRITNEIHYTEKSVKFVILKNP